MSTRERGPHPAVFRPLQRRFLSVPQAPVSYWLRDRFFELLAGRTLGDVANVCQGLATADDERFVRFVWEVPSAQWGIEVRTRRWVPFEKGGGYGKWFGHHFWAVDWEHDGTRLKRTTTERYGNAGKRIFNEEHFFVDGLTFSVTARGNLGVRALAGATFSSQGAAVVGRETTPSPSVLNARTSSALIRSITAQMYLRESYVARIPLPVDEPAQALVLETACLALKRWLVAREPTERTFDPETFETGKEGNAS